MDSASPIAQRIAGMTSFASGIFTFTFAIGTKIGGKNDSPNDAEYACEGSRGYRGPRVHRPSALGYGHLA